MDEDRRIRFLVSPALFVASLLIGAWPDPTTHKCIVDFFENRELSKSFIELAAAGSVVVFAGGYVFGTISHSVLRLYFLLRRRSWGGSHEAELDKDSRPQVWRRLRAPGNPNPNDASQDLYAVAAFDYDVLKKHHEGVHEWLFRRWNGFNIAVNSISALLLSLLVGYFIGIPLSLSWGLSVAFFGIVLVFVAIYAWKDTMRMVRFMASLEPNKSEQEAWPDKAEKKFVITLRR